MRNIIRIAIISAIFLGLLLFGISKYKPIRKPDKKLIHVTTTDNMLIGGLASDKEKIESFKKDFERKDDFNKLWEQLDISNDFRKKGDYEKAIFYREKALEFAKGQGECFQVRMGLAKLYEMAKHYDLALEEYNWLLNNTKRPDVIKELMESRERIEKVKAQTVNQIK